MGIMREERAKTHNSTEERERKSGELRVRKPGAEIVVERKGKGKGCLKCSTGLGGIILLVITSFFLVGLELQI